MMVKPCISFLSIVIEIGTTCKSMNSEKWIDRASYISAVSSLVPFILLAFLTDTKSIEESHEMSHLNLPADRVNGVNPLMYLVSI